MAQIICGLLKNLADAEKLKKASAKFSCSVRNSDRAEVLAELIEAGGVKMIAVDLDGHEAEGYRLIRLIGQSAVPLKPLVVGLVSQTKREAVEEAQRAGFSRVYLRTQFWREIDDILMRVMI